MNARKRLKGGERNHIVFLSRMPKENKMNFTLPAYPTEHDLWRHLKQTKKPILMYGMGNGADKILAHLDAREIEISDFFASDGFVRGHHFHGKRVLSYSEAKEKYGNFIVLLAFGSSLDDVIENILRIASEQELYAPDVPVCESELFDCEFYNKNYKEILRAYEILSDEVSKEIFSAVINFKLTGDIRYLCESICDDGMSLYEYNSYKICVDAGAYRGESSAELLSLGSNIEKIYALEPDAKTYAKLSGWAQEHSQVVPCNCGAWSEIGKGYFDSQGNRNSSFSDKGKTLTSLDKIDNIIGEDIPDYIKYDVEGCESEALDGSRRAISTYHPDLLVSVYHKSEDIFSLINKISDEYKGYSLYIRRKKYIPAWDVYICAKAR